jgi:hypothetical protein
VEGERDGLHQRRGRHVVGGVSRNGNQHHPVAAIGGARRLLGHQNQHGIGRDQLWSGVGAGIGGGGGQDVDRVAAADQVE